jgi:hypothetical protein
MPTPFTGSLGWGAAHPFQAGGPPLVGVWDRLLPTASGPLGAGALPLLAHAYQNDGVTALGTFGIRNRPSIAAKTTNGGLSPVTLEVVAGSVGSLYGLAVYGTSTYGGTTINLALGNVIRLTEQGGPFAGFVYSGIIEEFPDTRSATGTKHEILLTPFGFELTRVPSQALYTTPTDISAVVRDAVALAQHCSCDVVSVPRATGILLSIAGAVDFRGQKVAQVLDTCRSIAGATWFWYCDELGRVWFQAQGSAAVYTLMPSHVTERVSNGGSIVDRVNQVQAVGGVPIGGSANIQTVVNGASQATIGVRTLDPPLQVPGVTDRFTLASMADGILGTLDVAWTRFQALVAPTYTRRVHASQPGGAMVRYWEPSTNPLPETGAAAGYVGPYVVQTITYDGLTQRLEAGNIPVTNSTDIQNLLRTWVHRWTLQALQVTPAALNLQQTLTGSLQSGAGTLTPTGAPATLWTLNQAEFAAIDPNGVTRAEMGNLAANGVSPAQWGFRASGPTGSPIFDSLGLIGVASLLCQDSAFGTSAGAGAGYATIQNIPASGTNFTLIRASSLLCLSVIGVVLAAGATNYCALYHSVFQGATMIRQKAIGQVGFTIGVHYYLTGITVFTGVPAGTYTFLQQFALDAATTSVVFGGFGGGTLPQPSADVILLGG